MTDAVPPSSRTSRLPRTARRAQLLQVARDVFVEQGYHAASMDDIAEHAGVSKPVLYQHFPGKLDLYLALLEQSSTRVVDTVREALASTTDNPQRVEATIKLWFDHVAERRADFRLVFESDLTNDPVVRQQVDRVIGESAEAVAEIIVEGTGLTESAAQLLAVSLVGMGHFSARNWLAQGCALSQDEAVRLVTGLAWRGIGGFPRNDNQGDA